MNLSPSPNRSAQVVLADDFPAILKAVSTILTPHFEVVAAVGDGKAALDAAARTNPDLVLLDINMPELNGFRTAREFIKRHSRGRVVFLTAHEDDDYVSEALAVGAKGYVLKQRLQSDLLPALRVAHAGHFFISPHAFVSHTDQGLINPNRTTAAAATQAKTNGHNGHVLEFYSGENHFIDRMSEAVSTSLSAGKSVIVLLKQSHLQFVSRRLSSSGIDSDGAIKRGDYRPFSVENVASVVMPNRQLDAARFLTFFDALFARRSLDARRKCSEAVVLGNLANALWDLGYEHETALRAEQLWNDLARRYGCVVHCSYPVTHLSSARNREAVARICFEHSRVIPIDKSAHSVCI